MRKKIIDFFNLPEIKNLKQITTNQLLYWLSDKKIATNSGDAYYFIRVCNGMGVLEATSPKNYLIKRDVLKREDDKIEIT